MRVWPIECLWKSFQTVNCKWPILFLPSHWSDAVSKARAYPHIVTQICQRRQIERQIWLIRYRAGKRNQMGHTIFKLIIFWQSIVALKPQILMPVFEHTNCQPFLFALLLWLLGFDYGAHLLLRLWWEWRYRRLYLPPPTTTNYVLEVKIMGFGAKRSWRMYHGFDPILFRPGSRKN